MNKHLQRIQEILQQENLTAEQKSAAIKSLKDADKELEITAFKLDKTEKVKHTTAILLEETIAELEQKRKAVEVQNRELEIEAALERVRSRSMGMHRVEDLKGVVKEVYTQLKLLGFKLGVAAINIIDGATGDMDVWMDGEDSYELPESYHVPYFNHPGHNQHLAYWKNGERYAVIEISGSDKKTYDNYFFFHTDFVRVPEHTKNLMISQESLISSMAYMKYGAIGWAPVMLNEEQATVLQRFAKVFEQTYTRFLDLQNAEAQAREAQIEAALEKVRSRSLAMHQPNELKDVVAVLFERLKELNVGLDTASINIWNSGSKDVEVWSAAIRDNTIRANLYHSPYFDHPIILDVWNAYESGAQTFIKTYPREVKNSFVKHLLEFNDFKHLPEDRKKYMLEGKGYSIVYAFSKKVSLSIFNYDGVPFPQPVTGVLQRFAGVFEQAYTRFLDLQKAEAQTREAQIEAALERVRSRAMAMHTSQELRDVVHELRKQMGILGQRNLDTCVIHLHDESPDFIHAWAAIRPPDSEKEIMETTARVPKKGLLIIEEAIEAYTANRQDYVIINEGEKVRQWFGFIQKESPEAFIRVVESTKYAKPEEIRSFWSFADFAGGSLLMVTLDQPDETTRALLRRFSNVFGLAYLRFADLKQAEAQAREAQIQLALERIRARTMAMQQSNELAEAAQLLYQQFHSLGIKTYTCAYMFIEEDKNLQRGWTVIPDGTLLPDFIDFPLTGDPILDERFQSWKENRPLHEGEIHGEANKQHHQFLTAKVAPQFAEYIVADLPDQVFFYNANFSHGYLFIVNTSPLSSEEKSISIRFAKVFEQTYTRFLDLQKAETQAREAKIEASLERVRSRASAIRQSEELKEVILLIFRELKKLGLDLYECNILIFDNEPKNLIHWGSGTNDSEPNSVKVPYFDHPFLNDLFIDLEKGVKFRSGELSGASLKSFFKKLFTETDFKNTSQSYIEAMDKIERIFYSHAVMNHGFLEVIGDSPLPEDKADIIKRFTKVIDLTYTRFNDVLKAEAQAREAQIEAALERVRASMMAMHQSEGLPDVMKVISEQLIQLGNSMDAVSFMPINDRKDLNIWTATTLQTYPVEINIPYLDHPLFNTIYNAIQQGLDFTTVLLSIEDVKRWWKHFFDNSNVGSFILPERIAYIQETSGYASSIAFKKYSSLNLVNYHGVPFSDEENAILKRFGNVFEQTYTRFLDLQKAEVQARESQIQLALERVRAKTMAMQSSNDLLGVANVLREQMGNLGQPELESSIVHLYNDNSPMLEAWYAFRPPNLASRDIITGVGIVPKECSAWSREVMAKYNSSETEYTIVARGEKLTEWYKVLEQYARATVDYDKNGRLVVPEVLHYHFSKFSGGALLMISNQEPSAEARELQRRAAVVFDLAYTRFLDLKKAEAQAREAKIEAALEKVRSRSLAMHNSNELSELVATLFDELIKLDLVLARCIIWILNEDKSAQLWMANSENKQATSYHINGIDHSYYNSIFKGWQERSEHWVYELKDAEKASIDQILLFETELSQLPEEVKQGILSTTQTYVAGAFNKFGLIEASGPVHHTDEQLQILHRFNKVFEQSYTRFLDLQKAEAQAREAQIEASLERVRTKAMTMQTSDDLNALIGHIFMECTKLGLTLDRCLVLIVDPSTLDTEWILANPELPDHPSSYLVKYHEHPPYLKYLEAWKNKTERWHYVLSGKEKRDWDEFIFTETGLAQLPEPAKNVMRSLERIILNSSFGNFGNLTFSSFEPLTEHQFDLLIRFAKVLELTYTRFNDLKQAEARAKEAIKQAALDRVRADIASMRNTADLDRITPLIWKELTTLGIPFIRCGVFIMDVKENKVHTYLSTPEGHAIAAYHTSMDDSGSLAGAIEHWQQQKVFVTRWVESDFQTQADVLLKQGSITSREQYLNTLPKGGFHLHFLPFRQGMLYVGSHESLPSEVLQLVQSLADAFSVAYARYEDFTKLESAKAQIEKTLTDLKQTQTQLIQSEKMASLGELTAGIAHEIQNPLNFVNNFSEVSKELLDEMKAELDKGNPEEAKALAADIIQNLEKINFHGKRADGIVKSMLQHSRKSTNQKELTDMNALCDEYLRLSYHGLRAKDKSFNAKFEIQCDPELPKLNVLPQDVGRVILNLISNAFYAVSERLKAENLKPKAESVPYEPTVTVTTKNLVDRIEIRIRDNGTGIPEKVKEKIFQPFFTTKPTGQGTGLGLSLSYDIITKGHGGEIKMETKEGEGTEFTMVIPIS